MDIFQSLRTLFDSAGERLVLIQSPYSIASYLGALAVFALIYLVRRGERPRNWRRFPRLALPARILAHRSTRIDLRMFALNFGLLSSVYGAAVASTGLWRDLSLEGLDALFGPSAPVAAPAWLIIAVTTVAEVAMIDFGYWFSHYLMHRVPALWEFHKVHHSAEVMTPLTEWRQHPVEMIFIPNVIALTTGGVYGALFHVFGAAQPLTLWQTNCLLIVFFLTVSHLRHSHVWLPFTGWLGHLLHSPAHHQIHHSTLPQHHGKNLGFALSIWDWAFGTLWLPGRRERVRFGIGEEGRDFETVAASFAKPFVKAARLLRGAPPARRPTFDPPPP